MSSDTNCATPPSPSTATTVEAISREAFERWYAYHGDPNGYVEPAWQALRAALASRPAAQEAE